MCELLKSLPQMVKLGEGEFGSVYDVGNNRVMKVTRDKVDKNILDMASSSGVGPRIFGFELCPTGETYYIQQKLVDQFKLKYEQQLPELITRMFESGLLHNDLHTDNMMADETGRLYLIDFDMTERIMDVGLTNGSIRRHSSYLDIRTDTQIPIQFTETQMNRIKAIQQKPEVKQAEINSKLAAQKSREDARRQVEERTREAVRRITRTG